MEYSFTAVSKDYRVVITFPKYPTHIVLPDGWYSSGYISRIVDGFDASSLPLASDEVRNKIVNETLNRSTF